MRASGCSSPAPRPRASGARAGRLGPVLAAAATLLGLSLAVARDAAAQETGGAATLFRFPAGGVVTTGPVVADGRVWFIADSKTLFVITVEGKAIARRELPYRRAAFLACDPFGRAALPDGPSGIMLVNRAGQTAWRLELGAPPLGAPAFGADGRLYVALADPAGSLVALSQNGRRLWTRELGSPIALPPALGPGGGPLVALADGSAALLSPDGTVVWDESLPSAATALACLGEAALIACADGGLRVRNPLTPAQDGTAPEPARLGSPAVALASSPEGWYALGRDGTVTALDPAGTARWSLSPGGIGSPSGLAAFADRLVVLGSAGVASYDAAGSFFRRLAIANAAGTPAVAPSGAVFSGGADWILYAYGFERALEPLRREPPPSIGLDEAKRRADEEALWSGSAHEDDTVLSTLRDIDKSVKSGTIGEGARPAMAYAAAVALGMLEPPFGSGAVRPGPAPSGALPRAEACSLLGAYGSPIAVPALARVFEEDRDDAVRAAAAQAIAAIGLDPGGEASRAFARAAEGRMDERAAVAVIAAVAELYRANGSLDEPAGALALVRLMDSSYPRSVRAKAEAALRKISASW